MSTDGTYYRCKHCYEKSEIPFSHVTCKKSPSGFHEWDKKWEGAWVLWLIGIGVVLLLSLTLFLGPPVTLANSFGFVDLTSGIISGIVLYGLLITHYLLNKNELTKWSSWLLWSFAGLDIAIGVNYVYNIFNRGIGEELLGRMLAGVFVFDSTVDFVLQILLLAWIITALMGIAAAIFRNKESKVLRIAGVAGTGLLGVIAVIGISALASTTTTGLDDQKTTQEEASYSSEYGEDRTEGREKAYSSEVPAGFEKLLREKALFPIDYEDLMIESAELNTGWWEIDVHNANQAKYGGDPEIMPRLGSYRYHPSTGMLQYYEATDDTWYDWTEEGIEELGDNTLTEKEAKAVRTFVLEFVEASNTNDGDRLMAFYADEVNYYSWGDSPRSKIHTDKEKYFKRWPVREYSVREGDISIAVGDMGGVYYANFSMDYSVSHPSDNRESSGKSNVEMTIMTKDDLGKLSSGLWITRERSE